MKKNIPPFVLSLLLIFATSCSSDSSDDLEPIPDPDPDPVAVTYTNTVKAIIDSNCTTSACHDSNSPAAGINLTTYAGVKAAFETGTALAQIESGAMPKNASDLSATTINKIKAWIANNYEE